MAIRAKISRTALYQIERGNTSKPQAGTLRRISRALGVDLENLMDDVPRPSAVDVGGISSVTSTENDFAQARGAFPQAVGETSRIANIDRAEELIEKFRRLLSSPLAEGVAVIVEESYRHLPIIPMPEADEPTRYTPSMSMEVEAKHTRGSHRNAD